MGTMLTGDHDPVRCHQAAKARAQLINEIRELVCKYQSGHYYTYPDYSELPASYRQDSTSRRAHGASLGHSHVNKPGHITSVARNVPTMQCVCTGDPVLMEEISKFPIANVGYDTNMLIIEERRFQKYKHTEMYSQ